MLDWPAKTTTRTGTVCLGEYGGCARAIVTNKQQQQQYHRRHKEIDNSDDRILLLPRSVKEESSGVRWLLWYGVMIEGSSCMFMLVCGAVISIGKHSQKIARLRNRDTTFMKVRVNATTVR